MKWKLATKLCYICGDITVRLICECWAKPTMTKWLEIGAIDPPPPEILVLRRPLPRSASLAVGYVPAAGWAPSARRPRRPRRRRSRARCWGGIYACVTSACSVMGKGFIQGLAKRHTKQSLARLRRDQAEQVGNRRKEFFSLFFCNDLHFYCESEKCKTKWMNFQDKFSHHRKC